MAWIMAGIGRLPGGRLSSARKGVCEQCEQAQEPAGQKVYDLVPHGPAYPYAGLGGL